MVQAKSEIWQQQQQQQRLEVYLCLHGKNWSSSMCTWLIMEICIRLFSMTVPRNNVAADWFSAGASEAIVSGRTGALVSKDSIYEESGK